MSKLEQLISSICLMFGCAAIIADPESSDAIASEADEQAHAAYDMVTNSLNQLMLAAWEIRAVDDPGDEPVGNPDSKLN